MEQGRVYLALKKMREKQPGHLTQRDVADGAGISRGNYNKKENGSVVTTLQDLEKLSKFYGVPVWKLLKNDNESVETGNKNQTQENETVKRIIELTDVITTLNKIIQEKDAEIEKLREQIREKNLP